MNGHGDRKMHKKHKRFSDPNVRGNLPEGAFPFARRRDNEPQSDI